MRIGIESVSDSPSAVSMQYILEDTVQYVIFAHLVESALLFQVLLQQLSWHPVQPQVTNMARG